MALEADALRPGGETVITRLSDVLVVQALRAWLETDPAARTGWLGALRDAQIGRAIVPDPPRPGAGLDGGVARRQIAMSRSAFAARFTELVDEPAMRYVTRWRMHLALRPRCATRARRSATLAGRLGYHSEAAFAGRSSASSADPRAPSGGGPPSVRRAGDRRSLDRGPERRRY